MSAIKKPVAGKGKIMSVRILYSMAAAITALGLLFCIYSVIFGVNFKILNTSVSGVFLGIVVLYLGIFYFIKVRKLKKELLESESSFSWDNFRKPHKKRAE